MGALLWPQAAPRAACGGSDSAGMPGSSDERAIEAVLPTHPAIDAADENARSAAESLLTDRCVREAGFDPPPAPTVADFAASSRAADVKPMPYGPATTTDFMHALDVAKHPGRYSGDDTSLAAADKRITTWAMSLSPADQTRYTATVWGSDDDPAAHVDLKASEGGTSAIGGCMGRAYRKLYGNPAQWVIARDAVSALPVQVRREVVDTTEYRDAQTRWAKCVADAGLGVKDWDEAGKLARSGTRKEAVHIAQVTVECRQSAKLDQSIAAVQRRIASKTVERFESDVLAYAELAARGTEQARTVLEGHAAS